MNFEDNITTAERRHEEVCRHLSQIATELRALVHLLGLGAALGLFTLLLVVVLVCA